MPLAASPELCTSESTWIHRAQSVSLIPALLGRASGNSGCFRWCDCLEHRPWSLISRYPAPPVTLTSFPPCKVRSSPKWTNGAPTADISVRREAVGWWADSGDRVSWLGRLGSLGAVGVGYTTRSADCLGTFQCPTTFRVARLRRGSAPVTHENPWPDLVDPGVLGL